MPVLRHVSNETYRGSYLDSYHGSVAIIHIIVNSNPCRLTRLDPDLGARTCAVDEDRADVDARLGHILIRHPQNHIWVKMVVVSHDGRVRISDKGNQEQKSVIPMRGESRKCEHVKDRS